MNDSMKTFQIGGFIFPKTFTSRTHYDEFIVGLDADSGIERVPVRNPATAVGFSEFWFRLKESNEIIRVIEPDPPYTGRCELVTPAGRK